MNYNKGSVMHLMTSEKSSGIGRKTYHANGKRISRSMYFELTDKAIRIDTFYTVTKHIKGVPFTRHHKCIALREV